MLGLWRSKAKSEDVDEFYVDLRLSDIPAYQKMFERALRAIDIDVETAWSRGEEYDKAKLEKDGETINLLCEEVEQRGLKPDYLIIMIHQYIFADPWQREWHKEEWAKRVVHRKEIDYFPSGWDMYRLLERVT